MKTHLARRNAIKSIAAYAIFLGATGILVACNAEKPQFKSIDLTGADYAKGFALGDQNGKPRTLQEFAGKVVVVFFGFTQCPDVCPTTLPANSCSVRGLPFWSLNAKPLA